MASDNAPTPLWAKANPADIDARIMRFLAGDDVRLDQQLLGADIEASKAHVEGLARIGVLPAAEAEALLRELSALADAVDAGRFQLDDRYEDGHSAIEAHLTERLGDVGRKVHTGRSRNDQVLVATRLWLREHLGVLHRHCLKAARTALERARESQDIPMPGYTHLQRAVVSSAGMWFAAHAESFADDAEAARLVATWANANPLGTAAGYGVNLPLDRDHTTTRLGFDRPILSPIHAQNGRGKVELMALAALEQALLTVRRLAWDVSLFTSAEFAFVDLPDRMTTGSSIMPNKRNPDLVELLRAAYAPVAGAGAELRALLSLPSGYHRDLQNTKGPLLRALCHGLDAVELSTDLLASMTLRPDRMRAAIEPAMYATDLAIEQAAAGIPFRTAYKDAAAQATALAARTPEQSLNARTSLGGAANLGLDRLEARLDALG